MKMLAAAIFKVSKETHISVATTKDGNIRQRKRLLAITMYSDSTCT